MWIKVYPGSFPATMTLLHLTMIEYFSKTFFFYFYFFYAINTKFKSYCNKFKKNIEK